MISRMAWLEMHIVSIGLKIVDFQLSFKTKFGENIGSIEMTEKTQVI
jgi:hypothetical protein